jgi:hypothetical protein
VIGLDVLDNIQMSHELSEKILVLYGAEQTNLPRRAVPVLMDMSKSKPGV